MSVIMPETCQCALCGKQSEQTILASTNAYGPSDLDLRPPEMQRGTMPMWVQECPHCGYVWGSIEEKTAIDKAFLESAEYRTCGNRDFTSELAKQFYKQYLITQQEKKEEVGFYAALHAAWACDDVCDWENAAYCRLCAITQMEKLLEKTDDETLKVQKADLLRRAGLFDRVISEYSAAVFEDEMLQRIIVFQIEKAKEKDTDCYTVADVVKKDG